VQLLAFLVGTQLPGPMRGAMEAELGLPFPISSLAHFVLCAGIAAVLLCKPIDIGAFKVLLLMLALGFFTEGMQFFAIDRHPRWVDVFIDLSGAATSILVFRGFKLCFVRR
jgi:VanZ family protein